MDTNLSCNSVFYIMVVVSVVVRALVLVLALVLVTEFVTCTSSPDLSAVCGVVPALALTVTEHFRQFVSVTPSVCGGTASA